MGEKKQAVFIMCDTVNQNMVSCYQDPVCKTQCLENFSADASVFENAYTCSPVCGPARSAIFTGFFPSTNGLYGNGMQLGKNVKTIGQRLTDAGIHSGYIGKYHLDGGDYFGKGYAQEGWDPEYWYDMRNFLDEMDTPEQRKASRQNMGLHFWGEIKAEDTFAHRCIDRAVEFVERFKEENFFLVVSLDEPHDPCQCPPEFQKLQRESEYRLHPAPNTDAPLKDKPDIQKMWADKFRIALTPAMFYAFNRGIMACQMFVDQEIGRLLDVIREQLDAPLIFYTADHGEMMKAHGLLQKGACMYNEITRVPLIIKGPGFAARRVKTPVSHIDIVPTLLEYFEQPIPPNLQGESLYQLKKDARERDVFCEFFRFEVEQDGFLGYQPIRSIFNGRYKLNINLNSSDELYDEEKDPYELKNLMADPSYAAIRDQLHDRLLEHMNRTREPFRGYIWACRPWRKGKKPSYDFTGQERQDNDGESIRLTYSTGNPTTEFVRKKGIT